MDEVIEKLIHHLECGLEGDDINIYEAGMITDMIKDLAEAKYYCTVVEAMGEGKSIPYISSTMPKSMI